MIYSALFLSVMEKNMGEQRRVSFAVNGRCDIMLRIHGIARNNASGLAKAFRSA